MRKKLLNHKLRQRELIIWTHLAEIKYNVYIYIYIYSSENKKEVSNELYDSAVITYGAVAVSMVAKKVSGMPLGAPESLKNVAKLAVSIALSNMAVKWVQDKKHLPVNPLKSY